MLSAPTTLSTQDYESMLHKIDKRTSFNTGNRPRSKKNRRWSGHKKKSSQKQRGLCSALEAETLQMEMRLKILSDLKTKTKRELRHQKRHREQRGSLWASAKPQKGHDYIGKVLKKHRKENRLSFGRSLYDPYLGQRRDSAGKEKPKRNQPGKEKAITGKEKATRRMSDCSLEINNCKPSLPKAPRFDTSTLQREVKECEKIELKATKIDVEEDEKTANDWNAINQISEKQDEKTAHDWNAKEQTSQKPNPEAGCLWGSRTATPKANPEAGSLWGARPPTPEANPKAGCLWGERPPTPKAGTPGCLWGSSTSAKTLEPSSGSLWRSNEVRPRPASSMELKDINIFATRVQETGASPPWWLQEKKTETKRKVCYECFAWFSESESFEGEGKLYCSEACRDKSIEKLTAKCAFSGCEKRVPRTERRLRWKQYFFCCSNHVVFL